MAQANPPLTYCAGIRGQGFRRRQALGEAPRPDVRAGYYNPSAVWIYLGAKTLLLVLGVTFLVVTMVLIHVPAIAKVVPVMLGTGVLYFAPNMIVEARRRLCFPGHPADLPDALDLLEVCVSGVHRRSSPGSPFADESAASAPCSPTKWP